MTVAEQRIRDRADQKALDDLCVDRPLAQTCRSVRDTARGIGQHAPLDLNHSDADAVSISLTKAELALINNALNEVTNGGHIEDWEFETRLGASREEARSLLSGLSAAHRR